MSHVKIDKRELEDIIGEEISNEQLREEASFLGAHWNHVEGPKWDVEVYPDRPDLLSVEGLARAYRGFFQVDEGREEYGIEEGSLQVKVDDSVEEVRPYIGGAVVRGLDLTQKKINGLIQLQEKLHETMGRKRDKLAIGLHDLSRVESPFTYKAVEPEQVSFTPLEYDRDIDLEEILEKHEKGQEYAWILEDEDCYPVIVDSREKVLSFPPIINNQLTEVTTGTEDVFIDVTGKHRETVLKALNILVTALAERGGTIESVDVDGEELPDLSPREVKLGIDYFQDVSGLDLSGKEIAERLRQMKFDAEASGGEVKVGVPAYRTDIMHDYDLIEDVVIAHRYDNVEPALPEIDQEAREKPEERYAALLSDILSGTGALETNTYSLSSQEKLFEKMNVVKVGTVKMSNALTEDYTAVRNWLLPSLMEVLERNRHRSYPQKFYEVADVAKLDDSPTGASNRKKLAYLESGNDTDYTDAKQVLQVLERDFGVEFRVEAGARNCFKEDRAAELLLDGEKVGFMGEISEEVLENWGLERAAAGFEIDVEELVRLITS